MDDPLWSVSDAEYFEFAFDHLKRMFPLAKKDWVIEYKIWRAEYAQPVTEKHYSTYIVTKDTPFSNAWISTMAQIYPEDRGTNYAIREGVLAAQNILRKFNETNLIEN